MTEEHDKSAARPAGERLDADELFAKAWPEGATKSDLALLESLSEDQRDAALLRLEKMLEADLGVAKQASLARALGINRSYFLTLHRRWKVDRRLSTLVPYQARPARRMVRSRANELMELTVRRLLLRSPSRLRNSEIAKRATAREARRRDRLERMKGRSPDAPSTKIDLDRSRNDAALKIVHRVRRELASDVTWLKRRYGGEIALDVTAISLALVNEAGVHRQAIVALVIEAASGFILGHAMGSFEIALELSTSAIAMAKARLDRETLDVCDVASEKTNVSAIVADVPVPSSGGAGEMPSAVASDDHLELRRGSARRYGLLTREYIGPRIGRMIIHPRATYTGNAKLDLAGRRYVEAGPDDAAALWAYEVERHNQPIEDRLRNLKGLCPSGRMTAALMELEVVLQGNARLTIEDSALVNESS